MLANSELCAMSVSGPKTALTATKSNFRFTLDTVAKVVLHRRSKILRAVGVVFS
jgi:hypothetical protein